jgi:hypothetical protein
VGISEAANCDLRHTSVRPQTYREPRRFETTPSQPSAQHPKWSSQHQGLSRTTIFSSGAFIAYSTWSSGRQRDLGTNRQIQGGNRSRSTKTRLSLA